MRKRKGTTFTSITTLRSPRFGLLTELWYCYWNHRNTKDNESSSCPPLFMLSKWHKAIIHGMNFIQVGQSWSDGQNETKPSHRAVSLSTPFGTQFGIFWTSLGQFPWPHHPTSPRGCTRIKLNWTINFPFSKMEDIPPSNTINEIHRPRCFEWNAWGMVYGRASKQENRR